MLALRLVHVCPAPKGRLNVHNVAEALMRSSITPRPASTLWLSAGVDSDLVVNGAALPLAVLELKSKEPCLQVIMQTQRDQTLAGTMKQVFQMQPLSPKERKWARESVGAGGQL